MQATWHGFTTPQPLQCLSAPVSAMPLASRCSLLNVHLFFFLFFPPPPSLSGTTALHAAAIGNYSAVIRLLLTKGKADPNTQDLAKRTPLHYAAERGLLSACEDLVRGNASIEVVDRCGLTPPQAAQKAGFADVAAAMRSVSGRASAVNNDDEDSESFV